MYRVHRACRACNYAHPGPSGTKSPFNDKLISVLDLGIQPLANDFCGDEDERAGYAPLELLWCPKCSLAQLSVVVRPDILYSKYLYVTSPSETMKGHFKALLSDIRKECEPETCVEIASNDGLFLDFLEKEGLKVAGIEPAANLVEMSRNRGIQTTHDFFTLSAAVTTRVTFSKVDLVIARHVFCHIDDWHDFVHNLVELTDRDTLVCIEVPWVVDMLKGNSFDQIYHEHLSYLSVKSMVALLHGSPLHVHKVVHYPVHGGAIVLMLRRNDSTIPPDKSVQEFTNEEDIDLDCWHGFSQRTTKVEEDLNSFLMEARTKKKTVFGLGASAKSTVWLNNCGLSRKDIKVMCDSTLGKHYKFCPGTDIPITDEGAILRELPDYVVVFAWNFWAECLDKNKLAISKGVKFVRPIPQLEIV